jgi:uncharacterized membrane protein
MFLFWWPLSNSGTLFFVAVMMVLPAAIGGVALMREGRRSFGIGFFASYFGFWLTTAVMYAIFSVANRSGLQTLFIEVMGNHVRTLLLLLTIAVFIAITALLVKLMELPEHEQSITSPLVEPPKAKSLDSEVALPAPREDPIKWTPAGTDTDANKRR